MALSVYALSLLLLQFAFARANESRTLILLDNFVTKETHSIFFQSIKERGHNLTFKLSDDSTLALFKYGELLYQNLIIFSPNVEEFGGYINVNGILEFIDQGGNVLVVTGNKPSVALRELGAECGIEVDVYGNTLIDHFHYHSSDPFNHTVVVLDSNQLINAPVIVGSKDKINSVLYQGGGFLVNNTNPLVLPVLKAYPTSYCYNPNQPVIEHAPNLIGSNIALIVAIQARNNARVVFAGSLYLFSNEAMLGSDPSDEYSESGNFRLSVALSKWVLNEAGVIRVKSVKYEKEGQLGTPNGYTIMEQAVYTMEIEEKANDEWIPFNTNDLQLEFVRIDPFIRTYVPRVADGTYQVVFKIPDVYGVFKFMVDYRRIGYTSIFSSTQVSVRPLKHTEYERFITSAYPYYISAFSMMFGVFLFSFIILHVSDDKNKQD